MSELLRLTSEVSDEEIIKSLQAANVLVGRRYKSKRALYQKLNCDYSVGKNQENRDRILRRFINWEKVKGSWEIIITEMYDVPKPRTKRGRPPKDKLKIAAENAEKYRKNQYNYLVGYGICQLLSEQYKDRVAGNKKFSVGFFRSNLSYGLGLLPYDFYSLTKNKDKREEIIRSIFPEDWVITGQEMLMVVSCAKRVAGIYCLQGTKYLAEKSIISTIATQVYLDTESGEWRRMKEIERLKDHRIKEMVGEKVNWERGVLSHDIPLTLKTDYNYQDYARKEKVEQSKWGIPHSYYAIEMWVDPKELRHFVKKFKEKETAKERLQESYRTSLLKALDSSRTKKKIKTLRDFDILTTIPENIVTNNFAESAERICDFWKNTGFAGKNSPGVEKENVHELFFELRNGSTMRF